MKKQKKRVYVYVDDDELEQFKALALQKVGINNLSLLVRQLLREELLEQSAQGLPKQSNNVSGSPDDKNQGETKTGQFIRLSPQEKAWFVQLAKHKEMSVNALICTICVHIVKIIRNYLMTRLPPCNILTIKYRQSDAISIKLPSV